MVRIASYGPQTDQSHGENRLSHTIIRYIHTLNKNEIRISDLKTYENELNFKGIEFPVKLKDITNFENQNPSIPGVNVFSVNENKKIYPLRLNKKDCQKSIDLFLFEKDGKSHYSLIKNFSRLTRSQITSDTNSKIHICKTCLLHFTKEELFKKHIEYCLSTETVAVKMPPKRPYRNFKIIIKSTGRNNVFPFFVNSTET